jgi:hypothetical protein
VTGLDILREIVRITTEVDPGLHMLYPEFASALIRDDLMVRFHRWRPMRVSSLGQQRSLEAISE